MLCAHFYSLPRTYYKISAHPINLFSGAQLAVVSSAKQAKTKPKSSRSAVGFLVDFYFLLCIIEVSRTHVHKSLA